MPNGEPDPVLFDAAAQLQDAKEALPAAEDLLGILQEAGEDTTELRALILDAKQRIVRWEKALSRRGVNMPAKQEQEEGAG